MVGDPWGVVALRGVVSTGSSGTAGSCGSAGSCPHRDTSGGGSFIFAWGGKDVAVPLCVFNLQSWFSYRFDMKKWYSQQVAEGHAPRCTLGDDGFWAKETIGVVGKGGGDVAL